jgi:hypothetical protein
MCTTASDLVTPSVEQCCIIKFLLKEKVKPAEILCNLNAEYEEETLSCASVYDWKGKSPEGHKEVFNLPHAHIHPTAVCVMNICSIETLILGKSQITVRNIASNSGTVLEVLKQ